MTWYTVIQLIGIAFFACTGKVSLTATLYFSFVSVIHHTILFFFLIYFKQEFFNLSTNQPLQKINSANRITLLRISSLPTIIFLLRHKETTEIRTILLVLLILIFITDAFDGQIARHRKQITKIGQMLDSISDYCLLAVISVAYYLYNIVPRWLIGLIFIRLFLQSFGMLFFILLKRPLDIKSTWGGKITVAATMILYSAEFIRLYLPFRFEIYFKGLEYITGAVILILYLEKALIFFRHGRQPEAFK